MIRMKRRWWFDYYSAGAYSKIGAVKNAIIYVRNITSEPDIKALVEGAKHTSNILLIPYSHYSTIYKSKMLWAVVEDLSVPGIIQMCREGQCIYEEPRQCEYNLDFQYNIFKWIIVKSARSPLVKYLMWGIPIWDKSRTIISKYPEGIWKIKKQQLLKK